MTKQKRTPNKNNNTNINLSPKPKPARHLFFTETSTPSSINNLFSLGKFTSLNSIHFLEGSYKMKIIELRERFKKIQGDLVNDIDVKSKTSIDNRNVIANKLMNIGIELYKKLAPWSNKYRYREFALEILRDSEKSLKAAKELFELTGNNKLASLCREHLSAINPPINDNSPNLSNN